MGEMGGEGDVFRKMVKGMIFTRMRFPDINTKFDFLNNLPR